MDKIHGVCSSQKVKKGSLCNWSIDDKNENVNIDQNSNSEDTNSCTISKVIFTKLSIHALDKKQNLDNAEKYQLTCNESECGS